MKNREEKIIEGVTKVIIGNLAVKRIILFGSRAKEAKKKTGSDFDFAVDSEKPPLSKQRKIKEEIEKISGLYKVDIVYIPSVDEGFRKIIMTTGKVIYE